MHVCVCGNERVPAACVRWSWRGSGVMCPDTHTLIWPPPPILNLSSLAPLLSSLTHPGISRTCPHKSLPSYTRGNLTPRTRSKESSIQRRKWRRKWRRKIRGLRIFFSIHQGNAEIFIKGKLQPWNPSARYSRRAGKVSRRGGGLVTVKYNHKCKLDIFTTADS